MTRLMCGASWLVALLLIHSIGGCGFDVTAPCDNPSTDGVTVVLSFDDGPLPADLNEAEKLTGKESLLDPLGEILEVLQRRGIQAVFYVEGPGSDQAAKVLADAFAHGVYQIYQSGHVLAYHCFSHDVDIWADPELPQDLAEKRMNEDLDRLDAFLDDVLARLDLLRTDVFADLFRQPYIGAGLRCPAGWEVAAERGLTYRAARIDSLDWVVNSDATAVISFDLSGATEQDLTHLVLNRLRAGVAINADRTLVDVMLHVNNFTAAHLDEWIDQLTADYERFTDGPVRFAVPQCYIDTDDEFFDLVGSLGLLIKY